MQDTPVNLVLMPPCLHYKLVTQTRLLHVDMIAVPQVKDWQKQPLPSEPKFVLSGHQDGVTCLCADADLGIVASASHTGKCIVHLMSKSAYIRTIWHPKAGASIEMMTMAKGGEITMYSPVDKRLHLFDVNGNRLGACDAGPHNLTCMRLCLGGVALLTGDSAGQVVASSLSLESLVSFMVFQTKNQSNDSQYEDKTILYMCKSASILSHTCEHTCMTVHDAEDLLNHPPHVCVYLLMQCKPCPTSMVMKKTPHMASCVCECERCTCMLMVVHAHIMCMLFLHMAKSQTYPHKCADPSQQQC